MLNVSVGGHVRAPHVREAPDPRAAVGFTTVLVLSSSSPASGRLSFATRLAERRERRAEAHCELAGRDSLRGRVSRASPVRCCSFTSSLHSDAASRAPDPPAARRRNGGQARDNGYRVEWSPVQRAPGGISPSLRGGSDRSWAGVALPSRGCSLRCRL
jgi:hypothetical protein